MHGRRQLLLDFAAADAAAAEALNDDRAHEIWLTAALAELGHDPLGPAWRFVVYLVWLLTRAGPRDEVPRYVLRRSLREIAADSQMRQGNGRPWAEDTVGRAVRLVCRQGLVISHRVRRHGREAPKIYHLPVRAGLHSQAVPDWVRIQALSSPDYCPENSPENSPDYCPDYCRDFWPDSPADTVPSSSPQEGQPPPTIHPPQPLPEDWAAAAAALQRLGVKARREPIDRAQRHGLKPGDVLALCQHFAQFPGAWGPGALRWIVAEAYPPGPDDDVTKWAATDWPRKADGYINCQRDRAEVDRAAREASAAEVTRERQQRTAARCGRLLETMTVAERDELAVEAFGGSEPMWQRYRQRANSGFVRSMLLDALEKRLTHGPG